MTTTSLTIPSIFESSYGNTENSGTSLIDGIRIKHNDQWYIVGDLARRNGLHPHKLLNASTKDDDFEILFKSALVNVYHLINQPVHVTLGLPFATFNAYSKDVEAFLERKFFTVEFDTNTFSNKKGNINKISVEIDKFEVMPELVACIVGLKKMVANNDFKDFMIVSLGYGTLEGGVVTSNGLTQRSCFSTHGIRYVIQNVHRELNKKYNLELKNEFHINEALMKGYIYINRKKIDIRPMRKEILTQYYKEVVSPQMKNYFSDHDFETAERFFLVGGGSFYTELVDCFKLEFADVINVEVVNDPDKICSIGYLYNSLRVSDNTPNSCIGLDLGNSTTVVSVFE